MQTAHQELIGLVEKIRGKVFNPEIDAACDRILEIAASYLEEPDIMDQPEDIPAHLTPTERRMFSLLLKRRGRPVTKEALLNVGVRRWDSEPELKMVDVKICHIRKKIKGTQYAIDSLWGQGYRMAPAQMAA